MCGIAGQFGKGCAGFWIEKALDVMRHRGPDDSGYVALGMEGVTDPTRCPGEIGHCRLAILDQEHGKQPWQTKDCVVAFNGEVYNHQELREDWKIESRTRCDTEVVAYAIQNQYPLWHLDGMFAIAWYDETRGTIHLVRDRWGKKPLYYWISEDAQEIVFASEIKAILLHPRVRKEVDHQGIGIYLSLQYVPEPMTAFKGIRAVQPGCELVWSRGVMYPAEKQWYRYPTEKWDGESERGATEGWIELAVQKRLESDVPLGVYLSGGMDSSIVALIARSWVKNLKTFCIGFDVKGYDERGYAAEVARHLKTDHHTHVVTEDDLWGLVEDQIDIYDQPYGDCSSIPTTLLNRVAKEAGITVALAGDGGDEVFGGYPRYWHFNGRIEDYFRWVMVWPHVVARRMMSEEMKRVTSINATLDYLVCHLPEGHERDVRNAAMHLDAMTYLRNDIIVKMERASMASSVEVRCPFLDWRVMEYGMGIGSFDKIGELKPGHVHGKIMLEDAFCKQLPGEVFSRAKKGFGVPMDQWLRSAKGMELMDRTIGRSEWPGPRIVEPSIVAEYIIGHIEGKYTVGHGLWMLIMLYKWLEKNWG